MIVRIDEMIILWSYLAASLCESAGFYGKGLNFYNDGHISGTSLCKLEQEEQLILFFNCYKTLAPHYSVILKMC